MRAVGRGEVEHSDAGRGRPPGDDDHVGPGCCRHGHVPAAAGSAAVAPADAVPEPVETVKHTGLDAPGRPVGPAHAQRVLAGLDAVDHGAQHPAHHDHAAVRGGRRLLRVQGDRLLGALGPDVARVPVELVLGHLPTSCRSARRRTPPGSHALTEIDRLTQTVSGAWDSPIADQVAAQRGCPAGTARWWRSSASHVFVLPGNGRRRYLRCVPDSYRGPKSLAAVAELMARLSDGGSAVVRPVAAASGALTTTAATGLGAMHAMVVEPAPGAEVDVSELTESRAWHWGRHWPVCTAMPPGSMPVCPKPSANFPVSVNCLPMTPSWSRRRRGSPTP